MMNYNPSDPTLVDMEKQAQELEASCASKPCDKVPIPEQSFYIVDTNLKAKPVLIGLSLVVAFAVIEFAVQLF